MDVILDSNQLIADRWLESQRFSVLAHYLRRTSSRFWILAPVLVEVHEYLAREVRSHLEQINSARETLSRLQLEVEGPDVEPTVQQYMQSWNSHFEATIAEFGIVIPFDPTVTEEAFRRAAARLPPCKPNGTGMRDAVIWLSVLSACRSRAVHEVAFISANSKDFGDAEGRLRMELRDDASAAGRKVTWYDSVLAFNRAHSDRIAHITLEWLRGRVSPDELDEAVRQFILSRPSILHPANSDLRGIYEPEGEPYIHTLETSLADYTVWKLDSDEIALSLSISVFVEADAECSRLFSGSLRSSYYGTDSPPWTNTVVLTCHGDFEFYVTAEVVGDDVRVGVVDDFVLI